jgi:hypothetical protein
VGVKSWVGGWAAASLLVASGARAECGKDTDCKGDRVCNHGECVEPEAVSRETEPRLSEPRVIAVDSRPREDQERRRAELDVSYHPRSVPLMVGGIVLIVAAPVLLVGGGSLSQQTKDECRASHTAGAARDACDDDNRKRVTNILLGSVALLAVGIPLTFVGAKGVRDDNLGPEALLVPYATPNQGGLALRLRL